MLLGICLLVQAGVLVQVGTFAVVLYLLGVCVEWEFEGEEW
jgi:hypothetical protein